MKEKNASNVAADLEAILQRLQERLERYGARDAIDAILGGRRRATAVTSLRDHEIVQRFRHEIADGLIRVDTARQLLGLIRAVVDAAVKP